MRQLGVRFVAEFGLLVDVPPASREILTIVPLERTWSRPMAFEPLNSPEHRSPGGPPLLTAAEVGQLLGVPASWVYEQSRLGLNRIINVANLAADCFG